MAKLTARVSTKFGSPDPRPAAQPGVVKHLREQVVSALDGHTQHSRDCQLSGEYLADLVMPLFAAALAAPVSQDPVDADRIAEVIAEESANEVACGWKACSGCHETNEGYETGDYPYSEIFGCHVGSGCGECGGIGVVWEYWGKVSLDAMAQDVASPQPLTEGEPSEAEVERVAEALDDLHQQLVDCSMGDEFARKFARTALLAAKSKGGQADG